MKLCEKHYLIFGMTLFKLNNRNVFAYSFVSNCSTSSNKGYIFEGQTFAGHILPVGCSLRMPDFDKDVSEHLSLFSL